MPREFPRSRRIEEQIQRILSEILRVRVSDPRLGQVLISRVRTSRDISVAWVYFTSLDDDAPAGDLEAAMSAAAGFMRSQLARELSVRKIPELRFCFDNTEREGRRLEKLIDEAVARDRENDRSQTDG